MSTIWNPVVGASVPQDGELCEFLKLLTFLLSNTLIHPFGVGSVMMVCIPQWSPLLKSYTFKGDSQTRQSCIKLQQMEYSSVMRYIFKLDLKKESKRVDIMDLWKGRWSSSHWVKQAGGPLRAGVQRLKVGVSDCRC